MDQALLWYYGSPAEPTPEFRRVFDDAIDNWLQGALGEGYQEGEIPFSMIIYRIITGGENARNNGGNGAPQINRENFGQRDGGVNRVTRQLIIEKFFQQLQRVGVEAVNTGLVTRDSIESYDAAVILNLPAMTLMKTIFRSIHTNANQLLMADGTPVEEASAPGDFRNIVRSLILVRNHLNDYLRTGANATEAEAKRILNEKFRNNDFIIHNDHLKNVHQGLIGASVGISQLQDFRNYSQQTFNNIVNVTQ